MADATRWSAEVQGKNWNMTLVTMLQIQAIADTEGMRTLAVVVQCNLKYIIVSGHADRSNQIREFTLSECAPYQCSVWHFNVINTLCSSLNNASWLQTDNHVCYLVGLIKFSVWVLLRITAGGTVLVVFYATAEHIARLSAAACHANAVVRGSRQKLKICHNLQFVYFLLINISYTSITPKMP